MSNQMTVVKGTSTAIAAKLQEYAQHAKGAFSDNTIRAIKNDTAIFSTWCLDNQHNPLPASHETVAAFIDAMTDSGRAWATIKRYTSSIAHLHNAADIENPCAHSFVKLALKRMAKRQGTRQKQADALTFKERDAMIAATGSRLIDQRNRAIIATVYDTLARRSEIAALTITDIKAAGDGTGTVLIRKSKTDQEGQGSVRYLAADTMEHLLTWLDAAQIKDGALFSAITKSGVIGKPLRGADIARVLTKSANVAGVKGHITGHSARVGAAQDFIAAGIGLAEVMQAGGWKSGVMVARYTEHLQARRGAMSKLAAMQDR